MKLFRRVLSFLLAFALVLPCLLCLQASAYTSPLSESEMCLLVEALRDIEPQKESWELDGINFYDLRIGNPVQTYDYVNNALEPGRKMYPITVNGQLVLWATAHNGQYQLSRGLVKEVNNTIIQDTPFALIYDADSAYIYLNDTAILISNFPYTISTRSKLSTATNLASHEISLTSLNESVSIGYGSSPRASSLYQWCTVNYVPQVYSDICWAATIACIYNCINNLAGASALDAETVARSIFGASFNQQIFWGDVAEMLLEYDIDYRGALVYDSEPLNAADIHGSIMDGYPAFGCFDVIGGSEHAVTIYGSNVIAGRMVVMDPNGGTHTATINSNGDYTYVSSATNATLVLYGAFYDPG